MLYGEISTHCPLGRSVLVVVAHPDDESMFFSPSVLAFRKMGYTVRVLCLSTGNAYGLGRQRREELVAACKVLGVGAGHVIIVDRPDLQDGCRESWREGHVADEVAAAVGGDDVGTILTFDAGGVSGHPNHRDTSRGVRAFLERRAAGGGGGSIVAMQLDSVSLWRKFVGPLSIPLAHALGAAARAAARGSGAARSLVLVSPTPWVAAAAMRCHRTQWVWYRWLFVAFASYPYVNTLSPLQLGGKRHA